MGKAKLTNEEVISLCEEYQKGEGLRSLAHKYKLARKSIAMILRNESYRHVERPTVKVRSPDNVTPPEVSECILRLYKPYHERYSAAGLARIFKIHHKTVADIIRRGY